jgi:hypothetical protein
MSGSPVRNLARAATAPFRGYFNEHFEMVKDEVRRTTASVSVDDAGAWRQISELESAIAELTLYQTRVLNRLGDDVASLVSRIDELERVVGQLAAVVAASTVGSTADR